MTTKEKERKTRKENISFYIINHTIIILINTYTNRIARNKRNDDFSSMRTKNMFVI